MLLTDIYKILNSKVYQILNDEDIQELNIDSRNIGIVKNTVFFAIKADKRNGHDFLEAAYNKGVRNFIIQDIDGHDFLSECNYFVVKNSIQAMQSIAKFHRSTFNLQLLAITGSNGKTIVKEWLSEILGLTNIVVKSPKSYNSQIGVPLSIWQIKEKHQLGIFEAGISKKGEMSTLQDMLKPSIGLLTNIGSAHDEGFATREEKFNEKLLLFKNLEKLIIRENERSFVEKKKQDLGIKKLISWGRSLDNDYSVQIHKQPYNTIVLIHGYDYTLNFSDDANIENLCHCIIASLELGLTPVEIQNGISIIQPVAMRLEVKEANNDCIVIDDTYNHDEGGLKIALEFLNSQYSDRKKSVILSEIIQSGLAIKDQIQIFNRLLGALKLNHVILIGQSFHDNIKLFPKNFLVFSSTKEAQNTLNLNDFSNEVILIKGSRKLALESMVSFFEKKIHGTKLEINLSTLVQNLNFFRNKLSQNTKLMVMVKAFAYGSGSREVANLLQFSRVDYLGVAYASEGVDLRRMGVNLPIFVMNPSKETLKDCFVWNLEPEIFSLNSLQFFTQESKLHTHSLSVHINIDTGMRRLGFDYADIETLSGILKEEEIKVASIFSHLTSSDDKSDSEATYKQFDLFEAAYESIVSKIGYRPVKHILNTAGILNYPEKHFDMVRLGIGLYGVNIVGPEASGINSIARLTSEISQIRNVKAGDSIGYSRKGKLAKNGQIATIPIGYADGYSRSFSQGKGRVWINGKLAPVIGNVCMDMIMVDVSDIETKEGDQVIIFGPELPVEQLAIWSNTIPYEILTNISERVKRIYIND